jgi:uncharacterized membrane protein
VSAPARTPARTRSVERLSALLLFTLTYVSVGLLVIGVALMAAEGISPLSGGPGLRIATLGAQIRRLDPAAFLWLGLLTVIAAPIGRVVVAGVAYARERDWLMVGISVAILAVIAIGVASALAVTV